MNQELIDYVKEARKRGASDDELKNALQSSGWSSEETEKALNHNPDLPPPPKPHMHGLDPSHHGGQPQTPIAVVQSFSTRGIEYFIMFFSLWIAAVSFDWILNTIASHIFNNTGGAFFGTSTVSYAAASLIVALPIFSVLFLRLKKAELKNPSIRSDTSRRRAIQLTLFITFIAGIVDVIGYLYGLLNQSNSGTVGYASPSRGADFVHMLITLLVAGGIFAYYWIDIHRKDA